MASEEPVAIVKTTKGDVSITKSRIAQERRDRANFQKAYSELTFDLIGASAFTPAMTDAQRAVVAEVQSRAEENMLLDAFDGFYTVHQIITPPVDPLALVEIAQTSTALRPLIDSMVTNVSGFGISFPKTFDLDNPDHRDELKDHVEGRLLHVLETDGVEIIRKSFGEGVFTKSASEDDLYQNFLHEALTQIPVLKHATDKSNLGIALSAWPRYLHEYVVTHHRAFSKVRTRTLATSRRRIKEEMKDEIRYLRSFFDCVNPKISFHQIRAQQTEDLEMVGWWVLEVIRERETRRPVMFGHIPVAQMRKTRLGQRRMSWVPQRINRMEIVERQIPVSYRRYVQTLGQGGCFRWFKEFGDERIMDARTGQFVGIYSRDTGAWARLFYRSADDENSGFISENQFMQEYPDFEEATEILERSLYNPVGTPYPLPRWWGGRTLLQGMIAMEEVNSELFDNNMIPPYFLFVTGGKLSGASHIRIRDSLEALKRGRANFRRIVVLEAQTGTRNNGFANIGTPHIDVKSMADSIPNDASHSTYDEKGRTKVRSFWRLTPIHAGQELQMNKQSLLASLQAGEVQVFVPARKSEDDVYNTRLFPAMRINFYDFRSNSPPVSDNLEAAQVLEILTKSGILTVGETRTDAENILNRPLPRYHDEELNTSPFPLILIETKAQYGLRSDTSAENPEDAMGARPEKEGMAFESTVLKSQLEQEARLRFREEIVQCRIEKVQDRIQELFDEGHEAVWVRTEEGDYDLFAANSEGEVAFVIRKKRHAA